MFQQPWKLPNHCNSFSILHCSSKHSIKAYSIVLLQVLREKLPSFMHWMWTEPSVTTTNLQLIRKFARRYTNSPFLQSLRYLPGVP
mmetsp:Transcript_14761/g.2453  ORF Transcript_14761/g.2453 Transcript_14761/m.2453 type:complete len:86 (-) Transcript_14761:499-756(-)